MNAGRSMTGSETSHITVTYQDSGDEITSMYAVNGDILRELGRLLKKPTAKTCTHGLKPRDASSIPAMARHVSAASPAARWPRSITAMASGTERAARRLSGTTPTAQLSRNITAMARSIARVARRKED